MPGELLALLRTVYDDEGARIWLRARVTHLGGARPIDLIAAGRDEDVARSIEAMRSGAFV